jgi:hypothetical protein
VQNLYPAYLNHAADPAGVSAFVQQLQQGTTAAQVKAQILGSGEFFFARQGGAGSNFGFLSALFQDVLGRQIDDASLAYWGTLLAQGMSRIDVALGVLQSPDGSTRLVQTAFQNYLGRAADTSALSYWVPQLENGLSEQLFYAKLFASHEFYVKSS